MENKKEIEILKKRIASLEWKINYHQDMIDSYMVDLSIFKKALNEV